jgi:hypothetical protein
MNRRRNEELLAQIHEAIDALNASGIAPLLLKGAAYLKLRVYADGGARVLSDIDMLVAVEDASAARRALEAIGYVSVSRDARPGHHHLAPLLRAGSAGQIELHLAPVSPTVQHALPTAEAWRHRVDEDSGRFSVLSPLHTVLHRVIHDQIVDRYDAQRQLPLRSLLDLATLDAHYGTTLDWAAVLERVSRAGYARHFKRYLYAASRMAGLRPRLDVDFGLGESVHLGLCKSVIRWEFARGVLATLDDLSAFRIAKQVGGPQTFASMNAHRIRTLAQVLRRRWVA